MTQPSVPFITSDGTDPTPAGGPDARPEDIVGFPDGLPGFESCRRFVLAASDDDGPFRYLRAIDAPYPSFLVIDPTLVLKRYRTVVSRSDRARFGVADDDQLVWLAIVTLGQDGDAFVNLRAPVVVNPRTMTGFQAMPHQSLYPVRHPLRL
jgi:flagellar assembly factor FliW